MSKSSKRAGADGGQDFLVVGLGASAGGITALEEFFGLMPDDSGMAFVVVLHLSPEHESNLAAMLQRHTSMPVEQVNETLRVEPNRVYVIPPAKHLLMEEGRIRLAEPPAEPGRRVPIDLLFRTLGAAYREHAIGVVLSGTGSDGTLGLRRIKEEGGVSIAQEPGEAEYEGMPRSAIREGLADFVLPVAAMPEKLIGIRDASRRIKLPPEGDEPPKGKELNALRDILSMVRVRTGHDFSDYKQSTILRRVTRRMQMLEVPDLASYHRYLRHHPNELPELQQDFLISVTNFFRDTAAFDYLGREVVPRLFEGKREADQVRVWVTGCATGEEAYSLAILLDEHAAGLERPPRLQVFASDLDEDALGQARAGVFPETIAADVSPERLQNFFTFRDGHFHVRKRVRETILFASHNILRDPPFSNIDLVSCRNLLIYLNRGTQERVLEVFHFGLRPGGFLFLGSAESADLLPDYFSPFDKKLRVYQRTALASTLPHFPPVPALGRWEPRPAPDAEAVGVKAYRFAELHRALLEEYAPPSVLVNEAHDVVHVSEDAGRYLRVGGGEPTRNLLTLVHPDLRLDVRAALYAAVKGDAGQSSRAVKVGLDGGTRRVRVRVRPAARDNLRATYLLVIFEEEQEGAAEGAGGAGGGAAGEADRDVIATLEAELNQTRSVLRATVEQYETQTEELRASNEELQSLNEELRSATEELETSKEELQSVNEELHTVNAELKDRVAELERAEADLSNLFAATEIGTVFLDRELNITRYTPHFAELFNVIPADAGRPLAHLTHRLDYDGLPQDAARVLGRLSTVEREARSAEGRWYAARVLPYRTDAGRVAGVVITFTDITDRKLAELVAAERAEQLRLAASAASAAFWSLELATGAGAASEGWSTVMGFAPDGAARGLDALFRTVVAEDRPRLEAAIEAARGGQTDFVTDFRIEHPEHGRRRIHSQARVLASADAGPRLQGVVIDSTEGGAAAELRARLASVVELSGEAVITYGPDRRVVTWNTAAERLLGYAAGEAVGEDIALILPPDRAQEVERVFGVFETGVGVSGLETVCLAKDGRRVQVSVAASPVRGADGRPVGGAAVLHDISEERTAQLQLRTSELELRLILESVEDYAIFTLDLEGRITRWNRGAEKTFGFTAEEAVGQDTAIVFTPEDRAAGVHLKEMETALAAGRAEDERWHVRKDGSRFYASGVQTPLREGDDVRGFVKVARDLTERRRDEMERAELAAQLEAERETLEARVEERTSALFTEVAERRAAEERVRELVTRIVETQEQERRRISRDLHDVLGQQLTALRLNLAAVKEGCAEMDASLLNQVERAQAVASRLDAEVDFMAWELRPAALDELGLAAALENFVHEWSEHFEVAAEYHAAGLGKRRLAPELETNLYRVAQEALNNVSKHAGARRVGVILERRDRHFALIIEDDGRGFDPAEGAEGERGMGLVNMRERVALVGGTLEVESAPGVGTTVFARVPARYAEKK